MSIMDNIPEILQEVNKNSFQYKKRLQIFFSQAYNSRRYVCDGGVVSSFFWVWQNFNFSIIPVIVFRQEN